MKKITAKTVLALATFLSTAVLYANNPPPPPPPRQAQALPLDVNVLYLIVVGLFIAFYKFNYTKSNKA